MEPAVEKSIVMHLQNDNMVGGVGWLDSREGLPVWGALAR